MKPKSDVHDIDGDDALDIEYAYTVAGITYAGSDFREGEPDTTDAEYRASLHPVGRRTLVSYNPLDPSIAVLEPNDRRGLHRLVYGGALLIAVGLWLFLGPSGRSA